MAGNAPWRKSLAPALIVLFVSVLYVLAGWTARGGQLDALFDLGSRYRDLDPAGSEGYDGQFSYYIALDPQPSAVASRLDVPAYRYQRILLPLAARVLALGRPQFIPWALILISILIHAAATYGLGRLLVQRGLSAWYALTYGLWVGLLAGVGRGLLEPLAYGLVVFAYLAWRRQRWIAAGLLMAAALLAKETTLLFALAMALAALRAGWRAAKTRWSAGLPLLVIALWQAWLWRTFGQPGLGTGGAGASGFEVVPYLGLLRVIPFSMQYFIALLILLGATVLVPGLLALVHTGRRLLAGDRAFEIWALFLHAAALPFLPFSTFREPFAMMRIASGFVLATVLYGISERARRLLLLSFAWLAMLSMLIAAW